MSRLMGGLGDQIKLHLQVDRCGHHGPMAPSVAGPKAAGTRTRARTTAFGPWAHGDKTGLQVQVDLTSAS